MPTRDVETELASRGLISPDLEMLRPTVTRYSCLLLQPSGPIFASSQRIGHLNETVAAAKGAKFLELAKTRSAQLAVIPEYFLPWTALKSAINDSNVPSSDALWVLGCESATRESLEAFSREVSDKCLVIHEPWATLASGRTLLDPVVLLFQATRSDQSQQLVALVQFKTFPSRDPLFQEEEWLLKGNRVYRFRGRSGQMTVAAIICSDSLALTDAWLQDFTDRATLIHIQLNPNPRHVDYRRYRGTTFSTDSRATNCHIVALNWAHSIVQHSDDGPGPASWNNIAGSTWYCPADECSCDDAVVHPNHTRGVYYAYMTERRHALVLHYDEAVFELLVPKLFTTEPAVVANRNGPTCIHRYEWRGDPSSWHETSDAPDTGFLGLLAEHHEIEPVLRQVLNVSNVLGVERVLALTAGAINGTEQWLSAHNIDSCQIAADEVVRRITVAQDPSSLARSFRHERLACLANLQHIISTHDTWPPQVVGVDADARLHWERGIPHHNVVTASNVPTLIAFLGESPSAHLIQMVADMLFDLLRRAGGDHHKRLCILYRKHGDVRFATIPGLTRFDDPMEDKTDFLAVTPLDITDGASG